MNFFSCKQLAIILILCFVPNLALAKEPREVERADKYECRLISRGDAISRAKRRADGKVVGVQLSKKGARSVYRVRMLIDNKRVKTISIQACR